MVQEKLISLTEQHETWSDMKYKKRLSNDTGSGNDTESGNDKERIHRTEICPKSQLANDFTCTSVRKDLLLTLESLFVL